MAASATDTEKGRKTEREKKNEGTSNAAGGGAYRFSLLLLL